MTSFYDNDDGVGLKLLEGSGSVWCGTDLPRWYCDERIGISLYWSTMRTNPVVLEHSFDLMDRYFYVQWVDHHEKAFLLKGCMLVLSIVCYWVSEKVYLGYNGVRRLTLDEVEHWLRHVSRENITKLERSILTDLKWKVYKPTVGTFVLQYFDTLDHYLDSEGLVIHSCVLERALAIAEDTFPDYRLALFPKSIIGLASVEISFEIEMVGLVMPMKNLYLRSIDASLDRDAYEYAYQVIKQIRSVALLTCTSVQV
jgi:hypothetical protein